MLLERRTPAGDAMGIWARMQGWSDEDPAFAEIIAKINALDPAARSDALTTNLAQAVADVFPSSPSEPFDGKLEETNATISALVSPYVNADQSNVFVPKNSPMTSEGSMVVEIKYQAGEDKRRGYIFFSRYNTMIFTFTGQRPDVGLVSSVLDIPQDPQHSAIYLHCSPQARGRIRGRAGQ